MKNPANTTSGFTLIELSIVLVIVGLIIGGVLVGRDLISAAAVRAQISQIEKYQSAVNTFRGKYGYLPGDIPDPAASQYGFVARGAYEGEGDGDGILQGNVNNAAGGVIGCYQGMGENALFWVDLSAARLIDGNFSTGTANVAPSGNVTGGTLDLWFPKAKIGNSSYVYVWSGDLSCGSPNIRTNVNFFGVSAITQITPGSGKATSGTTISVAQAYAIDKKIDDGQPYSGNVVAMYDAGGIVATDQSWWIANSGTAASCTDNNGQVNMNPQTSPSAWRYSILQNGGAGQNCALSFQFQ